jgi:hypothetical protein
MFSACADSIQTVLKLLALGMSCKLNLLLNHSFVIVAAGTTAIWSRHVVDALRLGQQVLADADPRVTVDELNGVRNSCASTHRGDAGWKRRQDKTASGAVDSFLTVLRFLAGVVLGGLLRARHFFKRSFLFKTVSLVKA